MFQLTSKTNLNRLIISVICVLLGLVCFIAYKELKKPIPPIESIAAEYEIWSFDHLRKNTACKNKFQKRGRHGECIPNYVATPQQLLIDFRRIIKVNRDENAVKLLNGKQIVDSLSAEAQPFIQKLNKISDLNENDKLIQQLNKQELIKRINEQARKYLINHQTSETVSSGIQLYLLGVALDSSESMYELGYYYYLRKKDFSKYIEYMEQAALQGHPQAVSVMVDEYRTGKIVNQDALKELQFMELANKINNDDAYSHSVDRVSEGLFGPEFIIENTA